MAKPKPSKYSRARIRSKVRRPKRAGASRGWMVTTVGVVLVGVLLVVLTVLERQDAAKVAPKLGDHWHSYLGVNICGTWEPPVNEFHGRDGSMSQTPSAGIHSHGDYLIHEHPQSSDEAGKNATLGKYFEYAQTELSSTSIKLSSSWVPGVSKKNGDKCAEGKKPGVLQWKVGRYQKPWPTKPRTGDPADYRMKNGDIIAIYFGPLGDPLEQPPGSTEALANISDLDPEEQLPAASTTVPPVDATTPPTESTTLPTQDSTSSSSSPAGSTSTSRP